LRLEISPKTPSYTNIDSINGKSMFNLLGKHTYFVERLLVDAKKGITTEQHGPTRLFSSQYDSKSSALLIMLYHFTTNTMKNEGVKRK
jgi:hypothetical protein